MRTKGKKSILKTIRMTDEVEHILENDAKSKKISVGTLLSSLLTKYAEWDRFTEKYGFVSMPREFLKLMLETVDIDKLKDAVATYYGTAGPSEFLTFRSKRVDKETVLEHISAACKYAASAECDLGTHGKDQILIIHHDLGHKWSEILALVWAEGLFRHTLGFPTQYKITKNSLVIRFSEH
jgi:hypothetical protein